MKLQSSALAKKKFSISADNKLIGFVRLHDRIYEKKYKNKQYCNRNSEHQNDINVHNGGWHVTTLFLS